MKPCDRFLLPGLRIWKTALALALTALLMEFVLHDTPFFACVGALVAVERTRGESVRASLIRNIGTFAGGIVSVAISSFTDNLFWVSLGIVPFILLCLALGKRESVVAGGIVYLAVAYLNTTQGAWLYAARRIAGTLIGSLIGCAVNVLVCPPGEGAEAPARPGRVA